MRLRICYWCGKVRKKNSGKHFKSTDYYIKVNLIDFILYYLLGKITL